MAAESAGTEEIALRLASFRSRLDEVLAATGRPSGSVTLIGVSKFQPPERAIAAVQAGLTDLAENRVNELVEKVQLLEAAGVKPRWHLIGTLQRNKVRQAIACAHLIHSVDSLPLLNEIARRSAAMGKQTAVLLQVNISGEASKHGFEPDQVLGAARMARQLPEICLRGLMTMAPLSPDPEAAAPVFAAAQDMFWQIREEAGAGCDVLSMGMSGDFTTAVRYGATHIRIGTAIFGPRLSL